MHNICKWYDQNKVIIAITLDCANAFGVASHRSLIKMMSKFAEGRALSFLSQSLERKYKVVKDEIVTEAMLKAGTPTTISTIVSSTIVFILAKSRNSQTSTIVFILK